MYKYPPRKPNWFIGYRTRKSMKNIKIWEKANKYYGKLSIKTSLIIILMSLILWILEYFKILMLSETTLIIILFCEVVSIIFVGLIVEKKIKEEK